MLAEDIADKIADASLGIAEDDIYISELPFDTSNCISVVYAPSPAPNKALHYYAQAVDIRGRFDSYEAGYAKMKAIMDLFHRAQNYEMGDYHVYITYALGIIEYNDRDVERRHLFQLSLTFVYRDLDELS